MRVLVLTHVFPRDLDDPSAPFLLTWARALRDAGVDVGVLAPHDAGLPGRHEVDGIPVRLVRYGPARWERLAYRGEMHRLALRPAGPPLLAGLFGGLARAVLAEAARGQPDILHIHWWMPGAVAARLARTGVPTVCTVHGTDVGLIESRPWLRGLAHWSLSAADRVEAVSTDLAARLEQATGRSADAVNPMPLAVPADPVDPPQADPDGALRVLAVGRMVPEKGFGDLIAAAARLHFPVRVTLVGDGPEQEPLAGLAAELGVTADFPGRLSGAALRAAYAACDVVVQPSHQEGFGLVAAEALSAGVPVVATDSGGARDVLPRADLVPPGDVDGLAARLVAVAADPQARQRVLRSATRQRLIERLSPAAAAQRTIAAYEALTDGGVSV